MDVVEGRKEMYLLHGVKKLRDNVAMRRGLCLLFVVAPLLAQTSRGTITGTVLDQTGAVIAAARVALTGVDTGVRLSTVSNDTGVYRFDAVDPGAYELKVAHPGFQAYLATGIGVEANRVTTVDPRLSVGATESRIEVSAAASELLIRVVNQGRSAARRQFPGSRGARSPFAFAESDLAGACCPGRCWESD